MSDPRFYVMQERIATLTTALSAQSARVKSLEEDSQRLDWLQSRIVDTVYLDDGKIIDVRGNDLREAIDKAKMKWPNSLEDDDGDEKAAALLSSSEHRPVQSETETPSRLELIKLVNQMRAALVFWSAARFPEVPPIDPTGLGLAETTLHQMSKVPPITLE